MKDSVTHSASNPPAPWLLLFPFVSALLLLWVVPFGKSLYLSVQSDTLFGPTHFVGWKHFQSVFSDARFYHALGNTALYSLSLLLTVIPLSLWVAHLLHRLPEPSLSLFRYLLLVPGLTPPLVLGLLFVLVFSGKYGLLNQFLGSMGIPAIDWLKDPDWIPVSLLFQGVWRWTGFVSLFLLAGIRGIPKEYFAAAALEGASSWQQFVTITMPMLRNVLGFVALFLVLDSFVFFSGAYSLLGGSGGTADAGLLLAGYLYQTAFLYGKFGTAAAMGLIVSLGLASLLGVLIRWVLQQGGSRDVLD